MLDQKVVQYVVIGLILVLGIGASCYIYTLNEITISQTVHLMTSQEKITLISICLALTAIFIILIMLLKKQIHDQEAKEFSTWILCVVLVDW